jgi:hypothetical protein
MDTTKVDWGKYGKNFFLNPPFKVSEIGPIVEKAINESQRGCTVALIVPVWTNYEWCTELIRLGQVHEIVGLVFFEDYNGTKVVCNSGPRQIRVVFIGPNVKAGTNGPPIYAPKPPKKEKPDPEVVPSENKPEVRGGTDREPVQGQPYWLVERATNGTAADHRGYESNGSAHRRLRLIPLSSVEPKPTTWLWHRRIPLGDFTICEGDPADNKSSLLMDIAARVSTGRAMPDGTKGVLGNVLLLSAEDSLERTIVKRLDVAGADLRRIKAVDGEVSLPGTLKALEQAIRVADARLVIIDPLMAYLAADANGDQKVRRALTPLRNIAERANSAIVMVRHLVKRGGKHAMYRGSGSIGIIGAARSAVLVARSPSDEAFRVLAQVKNNLSVYPPSLLFEPVDVDGEVAIEWRGETELSANDLLSSGPVEDRLGEAMAFLAEVLKQGPIPQQEIRRRAIDAAIALRTLERAKEMLGAVSNRKGFGPGSVCFWHLPDAGTAP